MPDDIPVMSKLTDNQKIVLEQTNNKTIYVPQTNLRKIEYFEITQQLLFQLLIDYKIPIAQQTLHAIKEIDTFKIQKI